MSLTTMKRDLCLTHLWILLAMPLGAASGLIYVVNKAGTYIDVIDTATNKVVQTIDNIESPEVARFSPDGSRVYITSGGENVLDVVDRKSGKHIKKVPLSGWANDVAVTNDGKLIIVCIRNASKISHNVPGSIGDRETRGVDPGAMDFIDANSLEMVKSIPMKSGMHDMAVTADSKYAVAGSPEGHYLSAFDLRTKQIAWEIPYDQGLQPMVIENNPDGSGRRIFAQLAKLHGFVVVDFATHKEVARINLPEEPSRFGRGAGISHGIGIAPDGKTLWVNSRPANSVFAYSLPDIKLLGHVSLPELKLPGKAPKGARPGWITFSPDSKTVYVTNGSMKAVSAIDVKTMKEVANIPVGESPDRISTLTLP